MIESKQGVLGLFSSGAVAVPLVVLASFLLFRDPLFEFVDGKQALNT